MEGSSIVVVRRWNVEKLAWLMIRYYIVLPHLVERVSIVLDIVRMQSYRKKLIFILFYFIFLCCIFAD